MVVIVDDNSGDGATAALEAQLQVGHLVMMMIIVQRLLGDLC